MSVRLGSLGCAWWWRVFSGLFALATLSFLVFLVLLGSVCVCLLLFFLRGLFSEARSFLSCIGGFPVRSLGADFGLDTMV